MPDALTPKLSWLSRLVRRDCPESTKRFLGIMSCAALCVSLLTISGAVVVAVLRSSTHDVGTGTVAALASVVSGVTTLGALCFRKRDEQAGGAA